MFHLGVFMMRRRRPGGNLYELRKWGDAEWNAAR
jgi:hypothetical protein